MSRRSSKAAKSARRADRLDAATSRVTTPLAAFGRAVGTALFGVVALLIVLLLIASGINGLARWNAKRAAASGKTGVTSEERIKENLLIIGVEGKDAIGFLATRVDEKGKQVFGVAIPDDAFIEVPGQGFERIADSYVSGGDVSAAAISNYMGVTFRSWVVVPAAVYRDAMTKQSLAAVGQGVSASNLKRSELKDLSKKLASFKQKNVALVPLPVKSIKLGDTTYFEPQKTELADLLKSWWGVDASQTHSITRVIVYNGSGVPGIAGEAAQQLIRAGFRVVDTKNADNFAYSTTQIVVQKGPKKRGSAVVQVLGVGTVTYESSAQDIADVIVIIGKDYKPPVSGNQGGTTK